MVGCFRGVTNNLPLSSIPHDRAPFSTQPRAHRPPISRMLNVLHGRIYFKFESTEIGCQISCGPTCWFSSNNYGLAASCCGSIFWSAGLPFSFDVYWRCELKSDCLNVEWLPSCHDDVQPLFFKCIWRISPERKNHYMILTISIPRYSSRTLKSIFWTSHFPLLQNIL